MRDLERRYSWLLRLFYPAGYRRARGTEIIGTYLELAKQDRRWPSPTDVVDLALGGLRQHLRATNLGPGLRLAGPLALLAATVLAAAWMTLELYPPSDSWGPGFGPFVSVGAAVWAAWLLAAVLQVVTPGRWTRLAIGIAMLLTAAVVPFAAVTGQPRPPLFVLLPQIALGAVALIGVGRLPWWHRLLPLAAGVAAAPPAAVLLTSTDAYSGYYGWLASRTPSTIGIALLIVTISLSIALSVRGDHRGGWALLVLLGPVGTLSMHPLAAALDSPAGPGYAPNPTWSSLVTVALIVTIGGPALAVLALAAHRRTDPGRRWRRPMSDMRRSGSNN